MELSDLLTKYWGQTTLFLLGVGYVIKRVLDLQSKKTEINHSLFQQHRISAVRDFFLNYARVESMFYHLVVYDILSKKVSEKELDEIIFPPINDLKNSLMEMRIYFDKEDYVLFEKILDGFTSINNKLAELYFDFTNNENSVTKATFFKTFKSEALKKNEALMDEISQKIRLTYN